VRFSRPRSTQGNQQMAAAAPEDADSLSLRKLADSPDAAGPRSVPKADANGPRLHSPGGRCFIVLVRPLAPGPWGRDAPFARSGPQRRVRSVVSSLRPFTGLEFGSKFVSNLKGPSALAGERAHPAARKRARFSALPQARHAASPGPFGPAGSRASELPSLQSVDPLGFRNEERRGGPS
jgi:hypothetical protein